MNQAVRQNDGHAPVCDVDFYSDQTIADPVSAYHRMLGEDVEVNGVKIATGTRVLMVLGAANRDAARLEMTCLFESLAKRVKRFELAGPIVPAINASIYSMARVPLRALS
ncbi:MAG: hypothetical protein HRU27_03645 [Rhizobiaceae bacterium]|nr:hypothetical protein [Hyphomicrobiales bacterium]NRB29673.1 hypothetical protein [Rhizobiaceae bacterium]